MAFFTNFRHRSVMLHGLLWVLMGVTVVTPRAHADVRLVRATSTPPCWLVGDWREPEALLVAYDPTWSDAILELVQAIAPTPTWLLAEDESATRNWLRGLSLDHGVAMPVAVDSPWVRDYGPILCQSPNQSWRWGNAHYQSSRPRDDRLPALLTRAKGVALEALPWTLEGGGLSSNGTGLCVMTWASFRATRISLGAPEELEKFLQKVGCMVLTLIPALATEATGHVDMMMQFLSDHEVAIAQCDTPGCADDVQSLDAAAETVVQAAAMLAQTLQVVRVPLWSDGSKVYSYVNALHLGHRLLVPTYQAVPQATENAALQALQAALRDHTIVPVSADGLIGYGGALHCATLGLHGGAT